MIYHIILLFFHSHFNVLWHMYIHMQLFEETTESLLKWNEMKIYVLSRNQWAASSRHVRDVKICCWFESFHGSFLDAWRLSEMTCDIFCFSTTAFTFSLISRGRRAVNGHMQDTQAAVGTECEISQWQNRTVSPGLPAAHRTATVDATPAAQQFQRVNECVFL